MQEIINEIVKALVVTSIGAVAPLVVAVIVQLFRKVNIELGVAQQDQVRIVVQNILLEVEEWASHRIKASVPVTSGAKMERAIESIINKVPGINEEEAEQLVREELPKIGLGAVNFLAAASKAATNGK